MFNKEKKQIAMQMLQNTLTQIVQLEVRLESEIDKEVKPIKPGEVDKNMEAVKQIELLESQAEALKGVLESYEIDNYND